jgi:hypothetical protein
MRRLIDLAHSAHSLYFQRRSMVELRRLLEVGGWVA